MLDVVIIERIRKEREERRWRRERPRPWAPMEDRWEHPPRQEQEERPSDRGYAIIDFSI